MLNTDFYNFSLKFMEQTNLYSLSDIFLRFHEKVLWKTTLVKRIILFIRYPVFSAKHLRIILNKQNSVFLFYSIKEI